MATRGAIGIQLGDRIKAVYTHWDSYVAHNGYILQNFYNDSVVVNKLISMGDISALGAEIGEKHDFHDNNKEYAETACGVSVAKECTFYSRDRGEDTSWLSFEDAAHFVKEYTGWGAEYFYLFKNNKWYVKGRRGRWQVLSKALKTAV